MTDGTQVMAKIDALVMEPADPDREARAAAFVRRSLGDGGADILAYLGLKADR